MSHQIKLDDFREFKYEQQLAGSHGGIDTNKSLVAVTQYNDEYCQNWKDANTFTARFEVRSKVGDDSKVFFTSNFEKAVIAYNAI